MGRETQRKTVIAAFDFDGTLTVKDSLGPFIRHSVPFLKYLSFSAAFLPYLILFKLKLIPNFKAKEKLFTIFFAGVSIADFTIICKNFLPVLQKMMRPEAMAKLEWHKQMGHKVLVISASVQNYIIPWAANEDISVVLATTLEVKDDKLTGKFLSKNCYGQEKLVRFMDKFPQRTNYILYMYGDSAGDRELLKEADYPFYRSF